MGSDGRINGHTLQGAGCQKRRQAHFQRRALHQNPGMAFKQDINCGEIIDGTSSLETMGEQIFKLLIATASGQASKSEQHGYGQSEFVPWQVGAVM